jgi:uncharacterized coiled-coil protein SlyX
MSTPSRIAHLEAELASRDKTLDEIATALGRYHAWDHGWQRADDATLIARAKEIERESNARLDEPCEQRARAEKAEADEHSSGKRGNRLAQLCQDLTARNAEAEARLTERCALLGEVADGLVTKTKDLTARNAKLEAVAAAAWALLRDAAEFPPLRERFARDGLRAALEAIDAHPKVERDAELGR